MIFAFCSSIQAGMPIAIQVPCARAGGGLPAQSQVAAQLLWGPTLGLVIQAHALRVSCPQRAGKLHHPVPPGAHHAADEERAHERDALRGDAAATGSTVCLDDWRRQSRAVILAPAPPLCTSPGPQSRCREPGARAPRPYPPSSCCERTRTRHANSDNGDAGSGSSPPRPRQPSPASVPSQIAARDDVHHPAGERVAAGGRVASWGARCTL